MGTNVFANNNEIVSKGADGKSVAAFPDVCWTPPAPPVGPVPIPYPNSTEDKDLDNGTTTVQIKDKTVCMGDTSYIAKSKGDEGATQSQQKNLLTSSIQGKGYFITSSQDVKVEGKGATRHLDMMTHNHASPSGTGPQGQVSSVGSGGEGEKLQENKVEPDDAKLVSIELVTTNADLKSYYVADENQTKFVDNNENIVKYDTSLNAHIRFVNYFGELKIAYFKEKMKVSGFGDYPDSCFGKFVELRVRQDKETRIAKRYKVTMTRSNANNLYYSNNELNRHHYFLFYLEATASRGFAPDVNGNVSVSTQVSIENGKTKSIKLRLDMSGLSTYRVCVEEILDNSQKRSALKVESIEIKAQRIVIYDKYLDDFQSAPPGKALTIPQVDQAFVDLQAELAKCGVLMLCDTVYNLTSNDRINSMGDCYALAAKNNRHVPKQIDNDYKQCVDLGTIFQDHKNAIPECSDINFPNSEEKLAIYLDKIKKSIPSKELVRRGKISGNINSYIRKIKQDTKKGLKSIPGTKADVEKMLSDLEDQCYVSNVRSNQYIKYFWAIQCKDLFIPFKVHLFFLNSLANPPGMDAPAQTAGNVIAIRKAHSSTSTISLSVQLIHEFGHWMGLVPCSRGGTCVDLCNPSSCTNGYTDIVVKNNFVDAHQHYYSGKGGLGPHCSCGAQLNGDELSSGSCVMFHSAHNATFCAECLKSAIKSICTGSLT